MTEIKDEASESTANISMCCESEQSLSHHSPASGAVGLYVPLMMKQRQQQLLD